MKIDHTVLTKTIRYMGRITSVGCDAKCEKAWGMNSRPRKDDEMIEDELLWVAPVDPETYEGGVGKPQTPEERLNKWCVRECERCDMLPYEQSREAT